MQGKSEADEKKGIFGEGQLVLAMLTAFVSSGGLKKCGGLHLHLIRYGKWELIPS